MKRKKMKKKRRKRGTGNQYFTKETENSIVAYAATDDIARATNSVNKPKNI